MSTRKPIQSISTSSSSSSSSLPPLTRLGKDVGKPKRQRVLMPDPLIAIEDDLIGYPEDDPVDYRDEAEFADLLSVAQTSASTAVSNAAVEPVPTALRTAVVDPSASAGAGVPEGLTRPDGIQVIHAQSHPIVMLQELTPQSVRRWESNVRSRLAHDATASWQVSIDVKVRRYLEMEFHRLPQSQLRAGIFDEGGNLMKLMNIGFEALINALKCLYPEKLGVSYGPNAADQIAGLVRRWRICPTDFRNMMDLQDLLYEIHDWSSETYVMPKEEELLCIKALHTVLKAQESELSHHFASCIDKLNVGTVKEYLVALTTLSQEFNSARALGGLSMEYQSFNKRFESVSQSSSKTIPKKPYRSFVDTPIVSKKSTSRTGKECKGCGRLHAAKCRLDTHPNFNKTAKPWAESVIGMAFKKQGFDALPFDRTMSKQGDSYVLETAKRDDPATSKNHTLVSFDTSNELIYSNIYCNRVYRETKALIDTGSLSRDFISKALVTSCNYTVVQSNCDEVCSGFSHVCTHTFGTIPIEFRFFNEIVNNYETITLHPLILDTPFDIIIGKQSIKNFNLLEKVHAQFWGSDLNTDTRTTRYHARSLPQITSVTSGEYDTDSQPNSLARQCLALLVEKSNLIDYVDDSDGIENIIHELDWAPSTDESTTQIPKAIHGDIDFKLRLTNLCVEFKDIFSRQVTSDPARLPPFELLVDNSKWHSPKNRGPPRLQSNKIQSELKKQITEMLDLGVIRYSKANYYSHAMLIPKDPLADPIKYRFVLDYRKLNDATEAKSWPLPHIEQTLNRIGQHKPKYFGVLDLCAGYHQLPVAEASIPFTAFITYLGLFEWVRLPMGLKTAPGHFQQMMATIVLAGLIHIVCELYLDDCIIWGLTQDEFINRTRKVFLRFREFNVKVHPDKVVLGVEEIEYVGHVINSKGKTFSREKINKAIQLQKPINREQLKSFLGLANYFRNHIRSMSMLSNPLDKLLRNYTKRDAKAPIPWTPETTAAYEKILDGIKNCPMLHFIDESLPIFLHTDACSYGVGAYLFQRNDAGEEFPIAFISQSLSNNQLNWSIDVKEAYAIFYAFKKLEHLIRDAKFTLRTDHKNLVLINRGEGKILRWKLLIQTYDFNIEFIQGQNNGPADALSRLCLPEGTTVPYMLATLSAITEDELLDEAFRIPNDIYNLIARVHNSQVGHFGVELTLKRVLTNGVTTSNIRSYVRKFIQRCPCCQKMSYLKIPIHTSPYVTSTYSLMQRLNIDTIGPLPKSDDGCCYILVVIDTFSRYVELYATKTTQAEECAFQLLKHIGRYGAPAEITSDGGTQFVNEIVQSFLSIAKVQVNITIPYSKQENSIVERANKEVMRHLRAFIFDSMILTQWDLYLPLVMRILNAKIHESTGVSPAQLVLPGLDLDRRILTEDLSIEPQNLSAYASRLILMQDTAISVAQKYQLTLNAHHLNSQSEGCLTHFPINSYVLVMYPVQNNARKPPHKLASYWKGPFQVISSIGSEYQLLDLVTMKSSRVHISRLKSFHFEPGTDPRIVANTDTQSYDIKCVHRHTGSVKKPSTLQFLVEWIGFEDPSDYTWESWVKSNIQVHRYLTQKNLGHLIPRRFKLGE